MADGTIYAGISPVTNKPMYRLPAPPTPSFNPQPEISTKMDDGTVYAGISPETSAPMYTTPKDLKYVSSVDKTGLKSAHNWEDAVAHCQALKTGGHNDWHLPTEDELHVLFMNRSAIGGFAERNILDTTKSLNLWVYQSTHYWSSTLKNNSKHYKGNQYEEWLGNQPIAQYFGKNNATRSFDEDIQISTQTTLMSTNREAVRCVRSRKPPHPHP
jgi:hypothetical protein